MSYDASLTGVGIIVNRIRRGKETPWRASKIKLHYDLKDDSSWQNTVEFIAIVLAFAGLARLGVHDEDIIIRGDNVSSLQWAVSESFKSERARNASVLFTFIGLASTLNTSEGHHIAGKRHLVCDSLSRDNTRLEDHGFDPEDELWPQNDPTLATVLAIMDPTHSAMADEDTTAQFMTLCANLVSQWDSKVFGPKTLGVDTLTDEGCPVLELWNKRLEDEGEGRCGLGPLIPQSQFKRRVCAGPRAPHQVQTLYPLGGFESTPTPRGCEGHSHNKATVTRQH
jgi:hypothetical protein